MVKTANGRTGRTTAYFMFMNGIRATVMKENPGLKLGDISKIIGKKWRELPASTKEDWSRKAREKNDS